MQRIAAVAIARPLAAALAARPFYGRVAGVFDRACNLVNLEGQVVALSLPEVGCGPFSIVIKGQPGVFETLLPGQTALVAEHQFLRVGSWEITWQNARIWNPRLVCPPYSLQLNAEITALLEDCLDWPRLSVSKTQAAVIAETAAGLGQAVVNSIIDSNWLRLREEVTRLAGLGNGLTPAGDDYLLGVMAALWVTGQLEPLRLITAAATPRTTSLSAAFLSAAGNGEFMEPWHNLAHALFTGDVTGTARALQQIAGYGSSSGVDSLAGFANAILALRGSAAFPTL